MATPGFIDMHSHTDLEFLRDQAPDAKVCQGITTELLAQDGLGVAPIGAENVELMAELTAGLLGAPPQPASSARAKIPIAKSSLSAFIALLLVDGSSRDVGPLSQLALR